MQKNNRALSYLSCCGFAALVLVSQVAFAQANPSATGTTIQESFFGAWTSVMVTPYGRQQTDWVRSQRLVVSAFGMTT